MAQAPVLDFDTRYTECTSGNRAIRCGTSIEAYVALGLGGDVDEGIDAFGLGSWPSERSRRSRGSSRPFGVGDDLAHGLFGGPEACGEFSGLTRQSCSSACSTFSIMVDPSEPSALGLPPVCLCSRGLQAAATVRRTAWG